MSVPATKASTTNPLLLARIKANACSRRVVALISLIFLRSARKAAMVDFFHSISG